jgi:hypothetical protein
MYIYFFVKKEEEDGLQSCKISMSFSRIGKKGGIPR